MSHKYVKLFIGITIAFALIVPTQAIASTTQPLTGPPPNYMPYTIFDPSYDYLEDGYGGMFDLGDGEVSVYGHTFATFDVDVVGVQVTLQRWTGSVWINEDFGANSVFYNDSYSFSSRKINVLTGYYYRIKTTHWVEYNNVLEDGVRYTSSLLVVD